MGFERVLNGFMVYVSLMGGIYIEITPKHGTYSTKIDVYQFGVIQLLTLISQIDPQNN